ncbi:hypothetical protein vB_PsyM_KIL3b_0137 [Pseudomonas phage vB_PsyM_KIL3b]|nr:hypothetical protein vB_PsyM_KIL3_0137 [Pseudomonas phage vB_PsyM_KIL3]AMR58202.1 hypothetical protein vB_PsyM_KIL3b_0137 [Pseudomonas phage vB_PsyM_KIL3b]
MKNLPAEGALSMEEDELLHKAAKRISPAPCQ